MHVKTAKPIGPKFCVESHMTPGMILLWIFKMCLDKNIKIYHFSNNQILNENSSKKSSFTITKEK